jgi:hypothetical protein
MDEKSIHNAAKYNRLYYKMKMIEKRKLKKIQKIRSVIRRNQQDFKSQNIFNIENIQYQPYNFKYIKNQDITSTTDNIIETPISSNRINKYNINDIYELLKQINIY